MSKEERRNELSSSSGSRIEGLRDGLRKIIECEQGDVSNGQAIVLMREIAKLTLRVDDLLVDRENAECNHGVKAKP